MANDTLNPIELEFKKSVGGDVANAIKTFTSYNFDRNILTPASAFRFMAPGVDKETRLSIRSGDSVQLYGISPAGNQRQIATGIVDETDTHVQPNNVEYVLTGRDLLGQLIDNAAVDAANKIINTADLSMRNILSSLLKGTRIPQQFLDQQTPNGKLLFQTNPGETKINALQRFLDLTNCLVWCLPSGQVVMGKPNFTQDRSGKLVLSSSNPQQNNVIEGRSKRNLNQAIRQIVTQLQSLDQVDAGTYTKNNADGDLAAVAQGLVGRSVYRRVWYGQGNDSVNQVTQVGNQSGSPRKMGDEYSSRELARDNMKILDVEMVVEGHFNDSGDPYNIDQVYNVQIEDDDVNEDMYVYACSYELTVEHGLLTRLRLCRLGTIVAYADALRRTD